MDRRYSLRTCAIIITLSVLISWAPFVGLWLWLKPSGGLTIQRPPSRYQGDVQSTVHFSDNAELLCAIIKAPGRAIACGNPGGIMIVPNPCRWGDPYAELMCHEMAHVNGWPADHPKK